MSFGGKSEGGGDPSPGWDVFEKKQECRLEGQASQAGGGRRLGQHKASQEGLLAR